MIICLKKKRWRAFVQPADKYNIYLEGNSDKAALLIHGLTGAPSEMKYIAKHLHKEGYTVSAPLLAGHGVDMKTLLKTGWEDWLESIEKAYLELKKTHKHVYVAGICAGGALGLLLADKYPEIAGAVVYSMAFRYDGWNMGHLHKITPLLSLVAGLPKVRNIGFGEKYPFGIKDERLRKIITNTGQAYIPGALEHFPMGGLYQMYLMNNRLKKALPKMTTPTLMLHAKEDDVSHNRNSYAVQKLHGGKCSVVLLEDSYHMIHVDKERKKVAHLTADFFGKPQNQIGA